MLAYASKRQQAHREASGNLARPAAPTRTGVNEANAGPARATSSGLGHDFGRIPVHPPTPQRTTVVESANEFERRADVMAGQVMLLAEPPAIQRRCTGCADEEKQMLQPKSTAAQGDGAALNVGAAEGAARQGGESLPADVRSYFEPRFGYDFGAVRVHAGSEAAEAARGIQARAYTIGPDIVFGSGEYAAATLEGKWLLAHELTHVLQQDGRHAAFPAIQREPTPKRPAPKKPPPPFKPRAMTLDDVVKEMTGLGGPHADAKAWAATMKAGKFLGHEIDNGVRPEFQKVLDAAGKKVDDEYKKSGNPVPGGYGIRYIGGFRSEISPHGAGVAIDIDGGDNPYISHQSGNTTVTAELQPVYHRIAEFILNDPVDGEQSIIPKLITTGDSLPKGGNPSRRDRVGQYYDRLAKESEAMRKYFGLMNDDAALQAFLAGDWTKTHPRATPPAAADVKKQMWEDYAVLGGAVPKGGPAGIPDFKEPAAANRPFHPWRQPQKDPAAGFLTIPREVVLGLGQVVARWGAIDFGGESGDVMHFDDRYGVGKPFEDAKAPAQAKVNEENAKAKEAADKKAEEEKSAAEEKGAGSGSAAPPPQRKATVGSPNDAYERQANEVADRVVRMDTLEGGMPPPGAASAVPAAGRGGTPLPPETRAYFEPRLGHDFRAVRVHTDHEAAKAARGIEARAYTIGSHIVFGRGEYAPATADGRRLLAHELTHVAQQRTGAPDVVRRSIRPADVSQELVGQQFSLRKPFKEGARDLPAGAIVTVVSWSDSASTAEVSNAPVAGTFNVPKHLLVPSQPKTAGIAPYGVGLEKLESLGEKDAADLEAFKKTESTYKTAKGKAYFAKEVSDRETELSRVEKSLDVRLIQATMLNRFDPSIKKWVDFYNTQFGFTGAKALDSNLIKAMVYQESQMGTFGDFMSVPPTMVIMNRFNILQAIDSWPEEQLSVIHEAMPALIAKYHLQDIENELLKVETEFDTLKKKVGAGTAKSAEVTRFSELDAKRKPGDSWQVWFLEFRAPGETQGFKEAAEEFLNTTGSGGKAQKDDYDFWIRVGIRAVFEKHKLVSSWPEAARAYNGKGKKAEGYRDAVVQRAEQAVKAEKAGKEFVPGNL